jgi:hypothetical protein
MTEQTQENSSTSFKSEEEEAFDEYVKGGDYDAARDAYFKLLGFER